MVFCLPVCLCEGIRSPGTGVTDRCEMPCGWWEFNLGSLEEQPLSHLFSPQWFLKSNLKNLTQDHEESHLCFLLRVLSLELVNLGLCTELSFVLWLCSSLISFFYMWIRGCPNTVWSSTIVLESLCELATLKGFTFVISILLPWSTC